MKFFVSFLKLIRFPNLLIIGFTQYMVRYCILYPGLKGMEIQLGQYCLSMPPDGLHLLINDFDFFMLSLCYIMIAAAGYIINDYFDVKIDRINKPGQVVIDHGIRRRVAMGAHVVINSIAFLIGAWLSWKYDFFYPGTFIFGISIVLLWFYSTNLKRMFLIGNLSVAFLTGMVPMIIALFELKVQTRENNYCLHLAKADFWSLLLVVIVFSLFAFIVTLLREVIKDIEDYEGDLANGCETLPVTLGIRVSKNIAGTLSIGVMTLIALIQVKQFSFGDMKSFYYILFGIQLPFFILTMRLFTASRKSQFSVAGGLTKLIMISGICYLFLYRILLMQVYMDTLNQLQHAN